MLTFVRPLLRVPSDVCVCPSAAGFRDNVSLPFKTEEKEEFQAQIPGNSLENLRLFSHDATATGCTSLIIVGPLRAEWGGVWRVVGVMMITRSAR